MRRIAAGLIGGVVFGLMVVGSANASSYENERHEYRYNVYPNSGYRYYNDDRYEHRVVVRPSYNRPNVVSRPGTVYPNTYSNSYPVSMPYYGHDGGYERHERYDD
jgi:hypothetical protein